MKNIYIPSVLTIFLAFGSLNISQAQFVFADIPEQTISGPPVNCENTGNDILDFNGNTYTASVWDDSMPNTAGLGWQAGSYSGFIAFTSQTVEDPDVCLVKSSNNNIYAVAAYYSTSGVHQYIVEYFMLDASLTAFNYIGSANITLPGVLFGTTLNIDGNNNGEFAVVWDNNSNINIMTGHVLASGMPVLYNSGISLTIAPGESPDITFFNDGSGNDQVEVSYINYSNCVQVDIFRMADLIAGNINSTTAFISPPPYLAYHYPRIACSKTGFSTTNDWTVVVEDNDGVSSWLIAGFNYHTTSVVSTFNSYIYNGSNGYSPYNTSDVPNLRPVVAYDADNNAWIGWTMDNSTGFLPFSGALISQFPIVLVCKRRAEIAGGTNYLNVPSTLANGTTFKCLSLAGKYANDFFFTFFSEPTSSVLVKKIAHNPAPQALKENHHSNMVEWLNQTLNDQSSITNQNVFIFRIFDITGKEVISLKADAADLIDLLKTDKAIVPHGIYFASLISQNNNINYSGKFFIGQ